MQKATTLKVDTGTVTTTNLDVDNSALSSTQMDGGTLTLHLGGTTNTTDQLLWNAPGAATAGIYKVGTTLFYDADGTNSTGRNEVLLGTVTGNGTAASDFTISLETTNESGIDHLLSDLQFTTSNVTTIGQRTVTFTLTDSSGDNSTAATSKVFVVDQFYDMTTGNDVSSNSAFTGTTGTDAYEATSGELNNDSIDASTGTDFLVATLAVGTVTPSVNNVENIILTVQDHTIAGLDFTGVVHATNSSIDVVIEGGDVDSVTTVSNLGASVHSVDAGALTGGITFTAANSSLNVALTGGAGNDTFTMGTTLGAGDALTGGAGTDTLTAIINTSFTPSIVDVESINLTLTTSNTIDASLITGANGVTITLINDGTGDLTLTNIGATITTLVNADAANKLAATFAAAADVNATATGVSGDLNLNFGATLTGSDTVVGGMSVNDVVVAELSGVTATGTNINSLIAVNGVNFLNNGIEGNDALQINLANAQDSINVGDYAVVTGLTDASLLDFNGKAYAISAVAVSWINVDFGSSALFVANVANVANATVTVLDASQAVNDAPLQGLFNLTGVETINLSTTGTASVVDAVKIAGAPTTILASGAQGLTINDIQDALVTTINGSAMTGNLSLDVDVAANHALTGGNGADTFSLSRTALLNAADTILGGSGSDTLTAYMNGTSATLTVNGVETVTLNLLANTAITAATGLSATSLTIDDVTSTNASTWTFSADSMNDAVTSVNAAGMLGVVDIGNLGTLIAQGLTVANGIELTAANNVATITLLGDQTGTLATGDMVKIFGATGNDASFFDTEVYSITNVAYSNVGGNNDTTFTITLASNATGADVVNGVSVLEVGDGLGDGGVTYTAGAGAGDMLVGGSGNDTFTFGSTSGNTNYTSTDVVFGGAGSDTLSASIGGSITPAIYDVETINFATTAATTLITSSILNGTTGAVTIKLTGSNTVTIKDPGAAIGTISTSGASSAGVDLAFTDVSGSSSRNMTLDLGSGQPDKLRFEFDSAATIDNYGVITVKGFEQPGLSDQVLFYYGGTGDIVNYNNLNLINYDSDSNGTNDSVKITSAVSSLTFEVRIIGVLASQLDGSDIAFINANLT